MLIKQLEIDGSPVVLDKVLPFYQTDPFPGNHRYKMEIAFENEVARAKYIATKGLKDVKLANTGLFFLSLAGYFEQQGLTGNAPRFFINTIEEITEGNNTLIFTGIASDVIYGK